MEASEHPASDSSPTLTDTQRSDAASNISVSREKDRDLENGNGSHKPPTSDSAQHQTPDHPSLEHEKLPSADDDHSHGATLTRTRTDPHMTPLREAAFVAICISGQLFTQAGLGQSIPIQHLISPTLSSPPVSELSWFAAGYSLTVGTFILIAGRVGDILGHKPLFVFGWAWYALWSIVAGCSAYTHSAVFFDFCRAMQGVGPAVLLPCSLALLGRTYSPGRKKELVFALYGGAAPNGFLLGAAFSSLLAERVWWPWAYWVMGIACAVLGGLALLVVPDGEDDASSVGGQAFDWAGSVAGIAGLVLFNVAWNQAPIVGWGQPSVIVLLVLGVVVLGAFVVVEKRVKQPLVPLDALSGQSGFVLGCVGLGWSSFGIWLYYQWQFLGELRHNSPLVVTGQSSPTGISGVLAALTTAWLLSRVQPGIIMMVAMIAFMSGNLLLATCPIDQTYWFQTFLAQLITPWGMDMSFPCGTLILSNFVPKRHQGIAASLVATVVNYSISIGLGIGGTVDSYVNRGGNNVEDILRGYRGAWYAGIGLSGMGILLSGYFVWYGWRKGMGK